VAGISMPENNLGMARVRQSCPLMGTDWGK
jgi:hypothetical protein